MIATAHLVCAALAESGNTSSRCVDVKEKSVCEQAKTEGFCDIDGCLRTCGKCHIPDNWNMERARWFSFRRHKALVRKGDWWLMYGHAKGRYTTVVVPTICKRIDRLMLLVIRLRAEMQCVGEILLVARQPCLDQVKAALLTLQSHGISTSYGMSAKSSATDVMIGVVDMGQWDAIYGPAARFLAAQKARGQVIVHLDDDEMPCERQLCGIAAEALQEPLGIYGHHKRLCNPEKGYRQAGNPKNQRNWARFDVLLTLFAATSRAFNDIFVRHFDRYAAALASLRGNGEDIAYSHFLLRYFNRTPTYVPYAACYEWRVNGSVVERYEGGFAKFNAAKGISQMKRHYALRRAICRRFWNRTSWESLGWRGLAPADVLIPSPLYAGWPGNEVISHVNLSLNLQAEQDDDERSISGQR